METSPESQPVATPVPAFRRAFRFIFSPKNLIRLGVLAGLVLLFYVVENWRGKRAWETHKRELEARGESFDPKAFFPPMVPDAENILKVPGFDVWLTRGHKGHDPKKLKPLLPSLQDARPLKRPPLFELHIWLDSDGAPPADAIPAARLSSLDDLLRLAGVRAFAAPDDGGVILGSRPDLKPRRFIVRMAGKPDLSTPEKVGKLFPASRIGIRLELTDEKNVFRGSGLSVLVAEDVLELFRQHAAEVDAFREAFRRPHARFDNDLSDDPLTWPIVNSVFTLTIAQTMSAHAKACLLLGRPGAAMSDLAILARLMTYLRESSSSLWSAMIVAAIAGLYVDVVADGMSEGLWQEPQWIEIQQQLGGFELLKDVTQASRFGERAVSNVFFETLSKAGVAAFLDREFWAGMLDRPSLSFYLFVPRGWFYQNQLLNSHLTQQFLDAVDVKGQLIDPAKVGAATHTRDQAFERMTPYNVLANVMSPNYIKVFQNLAAQQTQINLARVACALERHRKANGGYPDSLAVLAPAFIDIVPHDIVNGQPLKYRRTEEGRYLLYSVAWNCKDDGGRSAGPNLSSRDSADWTWPAPKK
jgi:hypothetical protein